jgi:hypothetical protein
MILGLLYFNFILHMFTYLTVYYILLMILHKTKYFDGFPLSFIFFMYVYAKLFTSLVSCRDTDAIVRYSSDKYH